MNRILKIAFFYSIVLALVNQQIWALSIKKENETSKEIDNLSFENNANLKFVFLMKIFYR